MISMGRMLIGLAALSLMTAGAYLAYERLRPPPPPPPSAVSRAEAAQRCLDECEQAAIVAGRKDDVGLACRQRCGRAQVVAGPREPIRSISRAPADHSLALPSGPRIQRASAADLEALPPERRIQRSDPTHPPVATP
jgi:hypothetical protein